MRRFCNFIGLFIFIFIFIFFFGNFVQASILSFENIDSNLSWNKKNLNIYIQDNPIKIESIFKEWNKKNDFKFNFVKEQSNADIMVLFKDIKYNDYGALTTYYYKDSELLMSQIVLPYDFLDVKRKNDDLVLFVIRHEIGHSLGILFHSLNKKDVMYPIKTEFNNQITKNDIKQLRRTQKKVDGKINENILEKYKYDLPYLASAYKKAGKYEQAIEIYKKILLSNQNLVIAEYSLGYCYFKIKNYQFAEKYLKSAYEKDNDNAVFLNSYIRILCVQNKAHIANDILQKYISRNPESVKMPIINNCFRLIKENCKKV